MNVDTYGRVSRTRVRNTSRSNHAADILADLLRPFGGLGDGGGDAVGVGDIAFEEDGGVGG